MTTIYSSGLSRRQFLQRLSGFEIENVLAMQNSYGSRKEPMAAGVVVGGIELSVFIGPRDSVWVSLAHAKGNPELAKSLVEELQLTESETYPYVLDPPSGEIMQLWESAVGRNPMKPYLDFYGKGVGAEILKTEVDYIRNFFRGSKTLLDVGCGPGVFEKELAEFEIIGVDSSKEMLQLAKLQSNSRFVEAAAEGLPFRDSVFDGAFFVTSLEFVDDYKKAVDEAARVLGAGGKLLAMLLNPRSEYFKSHKPGGYLKSNIKTVDLDGIRGYISGKFDTSSEYILGVREGRAFQSKDPSTASLYAIKGAKRKPK